MPSANSPPAPDYSRGADLVCVADFADRQITGLAVSPQGRVFVNLPRWASDTDVSVGEVVDGVIRAYPDAEWNGWRNAEEKSPGDHFVCVQSLVFDPQGFLWVLDSASPAMEGPIKGAPKLVKIDVSADAVVDVLAFDDAVAPPGSYLNDVRFSPDGRFAYMTDSGVKGALVVADLRAKTAWRVLDGHPSTQAEPDVTPAVNGAPLRRPDGRKAKFAADGIALSADARTLYWQATTGETLYAVPTAALQDSTAARDAQEQVAKVGRTNVADGLWIDAAGRFYVTNPGDSSVEQADAPGGELRTLARDPERLIWPDTFSQGPDGAIWFITSHISDMPWFKPGATTTPSQIWKLEPKPAV